MTNDHDSDCAFAAFVHGELDPAQARAVAALVRRDTEAAARLRALQLADAALLEALATPRDSALPATAVWLRRSLAVAALLVVAVVLVLVRDGDRAVVANEHVGLVVTPVGGARHPVLTEIAFDLHWQRRGGAATRTLHVLPYGPVATLEAMGREFAATHRDTLGSALPLAVHAVLLAPDGRRLLARADYRGAIVQIGEDAVDQTLRVHDFALDPAAEPLFLFGRPTPDAFTEDFAWTFQHAKRDEPARWLPDLPGTWTVELHVVAVPPPHAGDWPVFAAPLVATTRLDLTGRCSAWGEPVDGMRARLVLATDCQGPAPFALQLQNVGDAPRRYNLSGNTRAAIPQPLHMALLTRDDAREASWPQRRDLGVITPAADEGRPHAAGAIRTVVASTGYWRRDDVVPPEVPGVRAIAAEFQFAMMAWIDPTDGHWQGTLRTGWIDLPR